MPLHLAEFSREAFQGYIENLPPAKTRILERFMPIKPVYDIKFSYNVINGKYARTASITGFNAGAPLRTKQGLEKAFGEVAKVQHGFRLDEEELLRFNQPRSDEEQQSVVEYIYDQTDELVEGVRDVEEWMRAQAIYTGKLQYNENDIKLDIDFGVPAGNKLTLVGSDAFSDHTNSQPLTVLQQMVQIYKNANKQKNPGEMHMSTAMLNDILANAQVKNHIYGSPTDARIVTRDQLQTLFESLGLPRFVINDDVVETNEGEVRLLPERRIVFLPNGTLGNLYQGITVENNYKPGMYVVTEIKETNPPMQAVYVGETIFPALAIPSAVAWIDA
jgi:Phage major capsid protein E